jgi:serine/threonine protein kinase
MAAAFELSIMVVSMDYNIRWKTIDEIGQGGQGKVYRVVNNIIASKIKELTIGIGKNLPDNPREKNPDKIEALSNSIVNLVEVKTDINNYHALKLLKKENARDPELQIKRIKLEIEALTQISHPNIVKIVDSDVDSEWFVMQYYPEGTLEKNRSKFKGDVLKCFKIIRPLVEGVSKLHKESYVHRDIKPQNIFIDNNGNLVLGDFGLLYFKENDERFSKTHENVGTYAWMPLWAMSKKMDDVKGNFDVFSLGKVLWSMLADKPILPLHYFNHAEYPQYKLELLLPGNKYVKLINDLLGKCIVEFERDCLPDATALLNEIDEIIVKIEKDTAWFSKDTKKYCKVCNIGEYVEADYRTINQYHAKNAYLTFECNHCGHIQLFGLNKDKLPDAWDN